MQELRLFVGACLLAFCTPTLAADLPTRPVYKAPAAVPVLPWHGWYVGVGGGYGWGDPVAHVDPALIPPFPFAAIAVGSFAPGAPFTLRTRPEGWLAGVLVGHHWQFGNHVVGVEADIYWSDMKDTDTGAFANSVVYDTGPGGTTGVVSLESGLRWFGTLRGRWGRPMGNALPYITGGLAYGNVRSTVTSTGTHFDNQGGVVNFGGSASFSDVLWGFSVGGGLDWAIDDLWRLRGEYLYLSLYGGNHSVAGAVPGVVSVSNEMDAHIARIAIVRRLPPL